jgi:hypothetical protein
MLANDHSVVRRGTGIATESPRAVVAVTVATNETPTTLTATWAPPTSGPVPDRYVVQAFSSGAFEGQAVCFGARCTTASIPGVRPNRTYTVTVYPAAGRSYGPGMTAAPIAVKTGCSGTAALCATVTTSTIGAADRRAQGFLEGAGAAAKTTLASGLHPRVWRLGTLLDDYTRFDNARNSGARIILILSDAWLAYGKDKPSGEANAPWTDWERYRTWVHDYATALVAAGRVPDYWEVQNEPGHGGYLSDADQAAWTPELALKQWAVAYREIKAVVPTAKVIGPSLDHFETQSADTTVLSIQQFLSYAKANGLVPGGLTWHEASAASTNGDSAALPVMTAYHVATARRMVTEAGLPAMAILVGEYGPFETHSFPGWTVGYIVAAESANADTAGRACWTEKAGNLTNECTDRSLDGVLSSDGTQPMANYWVHKFYADMGGNRLAVKPSTARISVFATKDASGVVRALFGRHEQCTTTNPNGCGALTPTRPTAQPGYLDVATGAVVRWHLTVQRVNASTSTTTPMTVLDQDVTAVSGNVHIDLPSINNNEAYTVVLTPRP